MPRSTAAAMRSISSPENRQRRHDHQHVAQGTEPHALAAGGVAHAHAATLLPRIGLLRLPVADQLDAGNQPALADVADLSQPGDSPQVSGQALDLRRQAGQGLFLLEDLERGQRDGRPQRIAAVGVTVEEGPALGIFSQEGPPDFLARQGDGQGQVAAGQPLGQAEKIRSDLLVLAGEHPPGAAAADGHFVGDQQHVVLPRQFPHAAKIAGRVHHHAGGGLHQGLDDHGGDPPVFHAEHTLQFFQVIGGQFFGWHAGGRAIGVGHGQTERLEQQRPEHGVKPLHPADAHAPQRIAVVGVAEGQVAGLFRPRLGPLPPILEGHLEGHFHGRGAVVGEEHVGQPRRRQIDQPPGELDGLGVRRAQVGDVGDAVELPAEGRIQPRVPMAVDIAPQAADAVDIGVAVDVEEQAALGALEHQRLVLGHLREGVPDQRAVPCLELLGRRLGHHFIPRP